MKKIFLLFIFICVILFSSCNLLGNNSSNPTTESTMVSSANKNVKNNYIDEGIKSMEIDDALLKNIILNYDIMFNRLCFNDEQIDFEKIFNYFYYAGFYNLQKNEVRDEMKKHYNDDGECSIPSNIVDDYLLRKFNTTIDHSVKEYDKNTDTYIIIPFSGEYYYDIIIDNTKILDDNKYKIECTIENAFMPGINKQLVFTIQFTENDYKFISVQETYRDEGFF